MPLSKLHDIKKPMHHYGTENRKVESSKLVKRPPISSPRKFSTHQESRHGGGKGIWYLAFVLIIGLFFGLSVFFTGATITITPTIENTALNERFIAYKKSVSKELTFETMIVDGSVSKSITTGEKQQVQDLARGKVVIFNNHGPEAQPLRIDTRLVDSKGRIYKTAQAVKVPGQSTKDGEIIPGSVEVEIYAEKPGDTYNELEKQTLKLIGFQEAKSPKFETITAETLGSIEGGFIGERYVVPEDQKAEIVTELTEQLSSELFDKSRAQVPEQSVFPEKLSILVDITTTESIQDDGSIKLTLNGSLFNILFNSVEFENYILQTSIVGVDQETAYIANLKNLNISYVDEALQTVNPESLENLAFQIDDVLEIISIVNKEALTFDLVGQRKKDFQTIIARYPGVEFVEFDINPFWRTHFPDSDEDIIVNLTTENKD